MTRFERKAMRLINYHMNCNVAKEVKDYIRDLEQAIAYLLDHPDCDTLTIRPSELPPHIREIVSRGKYRVLVSELEDIPKNMTLKAFQARLEQKDLNE